MKSIKRALVTIAIIVLFAAGWVYYRLNDHPKLDSYKNLMMAASPEEAGKHTDLRVTFLGVSTLLFDDGDTAILTDGFFTRPSKLRTFFGKIGPNREVIVGSLERAGIKKLRSVIAVHSHYDHALDAAFVATDWCGIDRLAIDGEHRRHRWAPDNNRARRRGAHSRSLPDHTNSLKSRSLLVLSQG